MGFTVAKDLEAKVARMVTPAVVHIAGQVEAEAKRRAPATKTWVHQGDERVRDTHVKAEGQVRPMNVRFHLHSMPEDQKNYGAGEFSHVKHPGFWTAGGGDFTSGVTANIYGCRCQWIIDQDGIAKLISSLPPTYTARKVTVIVRAHGIGVIEAERGDVYPPPVREPISHGTWFMAGAAARIATQRRNVRRTWEKHG